MIGATRPRVNFFRNKFKKLGFIECSGGLKVWFVAFDSNVLTYFLDGNKGNYSLTPNDSLAPQRIAAVRLFLYCKPVIVPTVKAEASDILNPAKCEEHMQFIVRQFAEFNPDDSQQASIEHRADELLLHHPTG